MLHPAILIVTGLSGSGKTSALKTLEDFGCEVVDNLPISLCSRLIQEKRISVPLALGIDVRTRDFSGPWFCSALEGLRHQYPHQVMVLFFEAQASALETRYRESRRQHPLGVSVSVSHLIQQEQGLLSSIRQQADHIIDTTHLSPPEMKSLLHHLLPIQEKSILYLLSFAYRRGVPYNADVVLDMRFLPNPYYQKNLKFLTGKSKEVREYFQQEPKLQQFLGLTVPILTDFMLQDARPSFVLAFGCSGGRHRSVFVAEATAALLEQKQYSCHVYHRDL